jgi:hypothetical protein
MARIDDTALSRTLVIGALVAVALVSLRGHLPGERPPPDTAAPTDSAAGGGASLAAVIAMLAVSTAVILLAVVTQSRRRVARAAGELPRAPGDLRGPVSRRMLVVAAVVLVLWVVVVVLLMRLTHPITVGGGGADPGSAPPPDPGRARPTRPRDPDRGLGSGVFESFAAATVVLFVLSLAAAAVVNRRRTLPPAAPGVIDTPVRSAPAAGPDLARAAEVGLAEIGDRSRDPREAIIACYVAMERELAKSPGTQPLDSDTPTEVLERAVARHALDAAQATRLVDLFEEARFSPHVMDESHRDDAERALSSVRAELQGAP